jgi:predicted nucleic acid-binding protein
MATIIDTSVWVDYFRTGTPDAIRLSACAAILHPDAALCEPVWFELLRCVPARQRAPILAHLDTLPRLETPASLWQDALHLGQACHAAGWVTGSMDLLIASLCLHHHATLVTFDRDFEGIAKVTALKLRLLPRPS